ncbi:Arginase/deacetylase [Calocera cornea HHB12733]|uniref:histone deacetylase n=1 Tax=Calocera cornea HHB12733 TaxID=1353952 RepID=A0A165GSA8_9BASI|nr:Arginase/deacetylase [Calocera cornea HHB12733]
MSDTQLYPTPPAENSNSSGERKKRQVKQVVLLFSPQLMALASLLPSNRDRARMLYALMHAYGLLRPFATVAPGGGSLQHGKRGSGAGGGGAREEEEEEEEEEGEGGTQYRILKPNAATRADLAEYHEREYLDYILSPSSAQAEGGEGQSALVLDDLGLTDDCPLFPHLPAYALLIAGASLTAASALLRGIATYALHWEGGRHHAHRGRAAGYCYVQDVVLAIQRLRSLQPVAQPARASGDIVGAEVGEQPKRRARVMYLDLDLHYADAVCQAFAHSRAGGVLTLSVHHASPGFYPSTACAALTRPDTADPYTLSLPLARGAGNGTYARLWPAVERVTAAFDPEYVVLQCGLDALAGDPCRTFNLGLDRAEEGSLGWMVERVLGWGRRTLFLGGGGYESANAARAWTYLTSIIAGRPLNARADIPDHVFFGQYAPSFTLDVPAGTMRDENTREALDNIVGVVDVLADRIRGLRCSM